MAYRLRIYSHNGDIHNFIYKGEANEEAVKNALNGICKFNPEVSLSSELEKLDDGSTFEEIDWDGQEKYMITVSNPLNEYIKEGEEEDVVYDGDDRVIEA
ncbi:hypothetical protein IWW36_000583 [Coemansia brasiliensis]|uniref:Uncharacterized protein n=1 Tax=Coemansia brasiliensis TaxID=2650707 RepID=A0A9W8ID44_9FUNG|nr:hypothetical protein IWW36_000583 [Coemansia brasiliensis]